ncbi:YcjX family protein [Brucella abortus]|nr:YcjX family protein [Brucella abortus]
MERWLSPGRLSVDIVDYPGEWLLDLPLLGKTYAQFSADSFALANEPTHRDLRLHGWPRRRLLPLPKRPMN